MVVVQVVLVERKGRERIGPRGQQIESVNAFAQRSGLRKRVKAPYGDQARAVTGVSVRASGTTPSGASGSTRIIAMCRFGGVGSSPARLASRCVTVFSNAPGPRSRVDNPESPRRVRKNRLATYTCARRRVSRVKCSLVSDTLSPSRLVTRCGAL